MKNIEENSLEDLAQKAITCLYIAVDASIADDVKQRVGAYICQLKRELAEAEANVKYWLNQHADEVARREEVEVEVSALAVAAKNMLHGISEGHTDCKCPDCVLRELAEKVLAHEGKPVTVTEPSNDKS